MRIGIRFVMLGRRGRCFFEDLDVGVMDEEDGLAWVHWKGVMFVGDLEYRYDGIIFVFRFFDIRLRDHFASLGVPSFNGAVLCSSVDFFMASTRDCVVHNDIYDSLTASSHAVIVDLQVQFAYDRIRPSVFDEPSSLLSTTSS